MEPLHARGERRGIEQEERESLARQASSARLSLQGSFASTTTLRIKRSSFSISRSFRLASGSRPGSNQRARGLTKGAAMHSRDPEDRSTHHDDDAESDLPGDPLLPAAVSEHEGEDEDDRGRDGRAPETVAALSFVGLRVRLAQDDGADSQAHGHDEGSHEVVDRDGPEAARIVHIRRSRARAPRGTPAGRSPKRTSRGPAPSLGRAAPRWRRGRRGSRRRAPPRASSARARASRRSSTGRVPARPRRAPPRGSP